MKNDDEFIEKEVSHTAPSDNLKKVYEDIGILEIINSYRHFPTGPSMYSRLTVN
jgi:hypothetical protein